VRRLSWGICRPPAGAGQKMSARRAGVDDGSRGSGSATRLRLTAGWD